MLLCYKIGNHIDVASGKWTAQDAGIGAGVDSYFEYLVKGAILFQKPQLMKEFHGILHIISSSFIVQIQFGVFWVAVYMWGADSLVVKSLGCGARGPGFESRCRRKVLGSDGIICKYLPLWVCPEFGMRACSLFRFVLIELRHWGEPSAVLWVPVWGYLRYPC